MSSIKFNGKTYSSLEEMPAAERMMYDQIMSVFADADKNGIPDIFEGDIVKNVLKFGSTSYVVDGRSMQSLDSLPPEVRSQVAQAFEKMKVMGLISGDIPLMSSGNQPGVDAAAIRPSLPLMQPNPVQSEVSTSRGLLLMLGVIVLVLCAGGAAYLLLLPR
jgi:hypothetical protein